jgi:hypothetical protein
MKLVNGINKAIPWETKTIQEEAGFDTGMTSIVTATCDNGDEVTLSQHESGDWDIGLNGEPHEEYNEDEGEQATKDFMRLVATKNAE